MSGDPALRLPAEIELGEPIGAGRRSRVYLARFEECTVALKIYRREYALRHRRRHHQSLARFEHDRNAAFYAVEPLRTFVARPIRVFGEDDGHRDAFVQQFVPGRPVRELVAECGAVPDETLTAIRGIIAAAESAGLHDIDLDPDNLRVRRTEQGWQPVLFDFNMVPQHVRAPNPWVALLYRTGLRDLSYRDRRWLRVLEQLRD